MKKLLLGAVASIAIAAAAAPAIAQAGPDGDVVQVWGELEEELADQLAEYGSRVEVVTAEQIRNGGFADAGQALQMSVPGLYLAPKNGAFDYVNVSLLGGRRVDVIWLIDGVRVSNRLYTTTTPLDTIPAHMIEKIEVIKGGQSLFYGTSAISGAINIVTKGFTRENEGSFSAGVDTNEGRHLSGSTSGGVGDHRYVVYASHDEASGFQPFRDADYQPSATDRTRGYDVTTFGAKYGFEFSDTLKFSANYQHTDGSLDFANAEDTYLSFNERDEDLLSAKLDWSVGDRFDFFVKAYYHWWDTEFTRLNNTVPVSGALIVSSDAEFWGFEDYGVNLLGQYQLTDAITLLGGADYQNYSGEDQVFLIAPQTEDVLAPFAQVRWDLGVLDGLRLAAGVRHNIPSGEGETTVWNVSGDLDINDYFYARGQVGTSFRLPDAYELFVADPCCEQGNPNLKGEESFNVEAGFGGRSDRVNWEVTAFRRELEDLIQIVTVGPIDTFDNSATPVEVTGAEFVATAQLTEDVTGTFDWTHTVAEFEGGSTQLQDIPRDTAKVLLDWAPMDLPFGAGASVAWVGDLYDTVTVQPPGAPTAGQVNIQHGDYVLVDLTARWYLDADRRHRLGFRIENAFDEEYDSQFVRVRLDGNDAVSYAAGNLGTERTFHVNYTFDF